MSRLLKLTLVASLFLAGCGETVVDDGAPPVAETEEGVGTSGFNELNLAAGTTVLYEVQVRSANACRPDVGAPWQREACARKISPTIPYRAEGMQCSSLAELKKIRQGTLDDMLEESADYQQGITLRYVKEKVGANMVWLMPLFPNNDTWSIPDPCDDLGSPYAVRDYLHAAGTLSRACIVQGRDEYSPEPCWGNEELDALLQQAHRRGLKVMLDLAFNHFGHNYLMYDYGEFTAVRERTGRGEDLNKLWDFAGTYEANLLRPEVLDTAKELEALAERNAVHRARLAALQRRCPSLSGDRLVRAYHMWREAFDFERERFDCEGYLEHNAPGFYLGSNSYDPASRAGDNFTNEWRDVKFLFHHEENVAHQWEFVRQREYLFRVMNYWVSRGVDGFRLDHTTDPQGGMGPNEWKYLVSKVDYYAWRRGQDRPIFLAEEFGDQMGMNQVVDVMTEGYLFDMCGRQGQTKDTRHVERAIDNMRRFNDHAFTMTTLETHDEHRLTDHTGFDVWTGAGFWGIGATTRSTPMLLMGQEFGEPWGLGFRRSDFLRGRFLGSGNDHPRGPALVDYYRAMIGGRLARENRALVSGSYAFLRSRWTGEADPRLFAQVKWSTDANVVFVFHNLWNQAVEQSYFIDDALASKLHLANGRLYRLVDVFSREQIGECRSGAQLKWDFYVSLSASTRAQWLRLESCD
ncbi:MAG: hypothetical protein HY901_30060 [Deltaproteobacteria bacterium]|nr:hypothetical protein [Deltaproteobacteria bacterium]